MKFITLVLSVIVLALTAVPCCAFDGREGHAHKNGLIEKKASGGQDDCCKDCSPFYVCGTCIGFTVASQQVLSFAVVLMPICHSTDYVSTGLPVIAVAIWQPPKLC